MIASVAAASSATGQANPAGSVCSRARIVAESEEGAAIPAIGKICWMTIKMPMPLINPEITGYGT